MAHRSTLRPAAQHEITTCTSCGRPESFRRRRIRRTRDTLAEKSGFLTNPSSIRSLRDLTKTDFPAAGLMVSGQHFIDAPQGTSEPHAKPAESLAIQKFPDAMRTSARIVKEVRIK